jgi:hypothetical protein
MRRQAAQPTGRASVASGPDKDRHWRALPSSASAAPGCERSEPKAAGLAAPTGVPLIRAAARPSIWRGAAGLWPQRGVRPSGALATPCEHAMRAQVVPAKDGTRA